jgi:hypothetical protein
MKRFLPHLIYLVLIAAVGVFYGQQLSIDSQWIILLNRITDEALFTARYINGERQNNISKMSKEYPSPKNDALTRMASSADSLVRVSYTDATVRDSLSSFLWVLVNREPVLAKVFSDLLPLKKQANISADYQTVMAQSDSLRRHWAQAVLLGYYTDFMGRPIICRGPPSIMVSHTVRCPVVGQPFETDIVLIDYAMSKEIHFSANGQTLQIKDGLAHFKNIYPRPGVYPLHVKTASILGGNDSLTIAEKTFYLHINN